MKEVSAFLSTPYKMELSLEKFAIKQETSFIKNRLNPKKCPGYDMI